MPIQLIVVISVLELLMSVNCRLVNFEEEGGLPGDLANEIAWVNGNLLNKTLASLAQGGCGNSIGNSKNHSTGC